MRTGRLVGLLAIVAAAFICGLLPGVVYYLLPSLPPVPDLSGTYTVEQLHANPEYFNSKRVRIRGVLRWEFEGNSLWGDPASVARNYSNSIWYSIASRELEELSERYSARWVIAEGVFSSKKRGHLSLFGGSITADRLELVKF